MKPWLSDGGGDGTFEDSAGWHVLREKAPLPGAVVNLAIFAEDQIWANGTRCREVYSTDAGGLLTRRAPLLVLSVKLTPPPAVDLCCVRCVLPDGCFAKIYPGSYVRWRPAVGS